MYIFNFSDQEANKPPDNPDDAPDKPKAREYIYRLKSNTKENATIVLLIKLFDYIDKHNRTPKAHENFLSLIKIS